MRFFGILPWLVALSTSVATASDDATPPPFFLQDPSDNLCLAGEDFKRCSIETLWYVVGSPGMCTQRHEDGYYHLHDG